MLRGAVAGLVGGVVSFELGDKAGLELEAHVAGDVANGVPTGLGIRAEALALNDGDVPMSELMEMGEGEFGGAAVMEGDVGDALGLVVAGDGDGGDGAAMGEQCVDGDDAFDRTIEKEGLRALDHGGLVMMADEEVEISGLEQVLFYACENEDGVAFADLGNEHPDRLAAAAAQGASGEIRTVLELFGRGEDAVLGRFRNGLSGGSGVEDAGDGGGRKAEVLGESFEADGGLKDGRPERFTV